MRLPEFVVSLAGIGGIIWMADHNARRWAALPHRFRPRPARRRADRVTVLVAAVMVLSGLCGLALMAFAR